MCLRVQGNAVNTPVQNTKEITIKNGYEKNPFIVFGICLVRSNSKSNKEVTSEEHSTKSKIYPPNPHLSLQNKCKPNCIFDV